MSYIDPVEASAANYKLLVEDDPVRRPEMTVQAGERDEVRAHPQRL